MKNKVKILNLIMLVSMLFLLCACTTGKSESKEAKPTDNKETEVTEVTAPFTAALPGEYDSKDTSVVTKVSKVTDSITFYNYGLSKSYTLSFDKVTSFYDKYEIPMSVDQVNQGDIVDISFLKGKKLLVSLKERKDALSLPDVTGFEINENAKKFNYGSDSYKITDSTIVLAENEKRALSDLSEIDHVSISGIDKDIYCITLKTGHGTLSLKGQDELIDGVIEVGGNILTIKKNLTIDLPEGEFDATISKGKTSVNRKVNIQRDQKATLDLSDVVLEEDKMGRVYFDVYPKEAKLYIDSKLVDSSELIELTIGTHKVEAVMDGYETFTRVLNVGEETATMSVILEEKETQDSSKAKEDSKTKGFYLRVNTPVGAEVEIDGNYVGVAPIAVEKVAGSHTIKLTKNGYVTRTYTVVVENTAADSNYSFSDLLPVGTVTSNE